LGVVITELFRTVANGLFAQQGLLWVLSALVIAGVTLVVRTWQERKILCYEEVYNSKIGFHRPFDRQESGEYESILRNFNNVSVVVLRVWNGGRAKIDADDFTRPLEFVAYDRFIVDFRVSTPQPPQVATAEDVEAKWRVSSVSDGLAAPRSRLLGQTELRRTLPESLYSESEGGFNEGERRMRRKLTIPPLSLRRGHSFKIVVCLREDADLDEDESPTKGYQFGGRLQPGKIVQRGARRRRRPTLVQLSATVLVLSLIAVLVWAFGPRPADFCTDGTLELVGSSAFSSTAQFAADGFSAECTRSRVGLAMRGSVEGVRQLSRADGPMVAFSDGVAPEGEGLNVDPVAVITYNIVVNASVGLSDLTTAQLQDINAGRVTNWSQIGGPNLPVRIVGRDADSGSRSTYERYVLGTGEAQLSSTSCEEADRGFPSPVIRCERPTTQQVLSEVNRIDGAIGYADASAIGAYPRARPVTIDKTQGSPEYIEHGYPFWTIEYAYRPGSDKNGSLADNFVRYLRSAPVSQQMYEEGYLPCFQSDGARHRLCQLNSR
jgi:phosphate transport system substrate-binding protein